MTKSSASASADKTLQALLTQLAEARFSWISSVRPDGRPHSVPICHVLYGGRIYLATPSRSVKVANIRANPNVVVAAYLEDPEAGLIVEGQAALRPESRPLLSPSFEEKYSWNLNEDDEHDALIEVTASKLIAWGRYGQGRWSGGEILRAAQSGIDQERSKS